MSGQATPPVNPQNGENNQSAFSRVFSIAQRVFIFWVISQLISKFLSSKLAAPTSPDPSTFTDSKDAQISHSTQSLPTSATPAWPLGLNLTMFIYLSPFSTVAEVLENAQLRVDSLVDNKHGIVKSLAWENITYGSWDEKFIADLTVHLPSSVQKNGSFWADIFLVKNSALVEFSERKFDPFSVHHIRKQLNKYLPRAKHRKEKSLLSSSDSDSDTDLVEESFSDSIVSHWHSNLTIALVSDASTVPYSQLPPAVVEHVHLVPDLRDETGTKALYEPVIFPNDFWHLRSQYFEINETTPTVPLRINFQPMSYFMFQLFASMGHGFNEAAKQKGASSGAEIDEIKRMLVETNPWFLGLTATVSILHVIFEMLAFTSDISHWRKKKELTGVSVRTIFTNVIIQTIILLYLLDNNEQTSWMIYMGQGVGILIEAWKITKVMDINVVPSAPGSLSPYTIKVTDKHVLSADEKKTQEYDRLASKYVLYATIPLLAGYSIYSVLYETHRGWYSFILSTLTSFVYMFGFAQLIPQLIINYKLKSVAHMPMKAMIFKTLSTVVDDLFAFCIKMPFLHRLACFRDDVVFLVFLYQRWIYRIDPKRVNEYGQVLNNSPDDKTVSEAVNKKELESKKKR